MLKVFFVIFAPLLIGALFIVFSNNNLSRQILNSAKDAIEEDPGGPDLTPHALSIENLRQGEYPGSEIVIEQELPPGSNYSRSIVSYKSEGLKIYALLTVPSGNAPEGGWPVIIFNHGYIPPAQYRTTERYISYTDGFSRNGYVLLRPDYRGHGNSEGVAGGGYGSNDYTIDVLNAVASVKRLSYINPEKIGMWGHSMGGHITFRNMVVSEDIKAGVIWAGVVGPYPDLFLRGQGSNLNAKATPRPTNPANFGRSSWRAQLIGEHGTYEENKDFWDKLSAVGYVSDLSGPIQFHHGTGDSSVPVEVSEYVEPILRSAGKSGGIYIYPGDDHDITNNFGVAMQRSVDFFDQHLK